MTLVLHSLFSNLSLRESFSESPLDFFELLKSGGACWDRIRWSPQDSPIIENLLFDSAKQQHLRDTYIDFLLYKHSKISGKDMQAQEIERCFESAILRWMQCMVSGIEVVELVEHRIKKSGSLRLFKTLVRCLEKLGERPMHLEPLARSIPHLTLMRYRQIRHVPPIARNLLCSSMMRLAIFIESRMWQYVLTGEVYFKKRRFSLARSLLFDPQGAIFILSKSKVKLLDGLQPNFKKMRTAILLPLWDRRFGAVVAHGVTPKNESYKLKNPSTIRELWFAEKLRGKPNIVELLHHTTITLAASNGEEIPRINMIWEYIKYDAWQIVSRKLQADMRYLLFIAQGAISGVCEMHALQFIHGDIKPENLLFYRDRVALCDFGFTFVAGFEPPNHIIRRGYYGSIVFTAPELFGNKNFTGNFFKVEVYALGFVLYQLFFKQTPVWASFLIQCHKDKVVVTDEQKQYFLAQVKNEIDAWLQKNPFPTSPSDRIKSIIFSMMQSDPARRPTIFDCLEQVQRFTY